MREDDADEGTGDDPLAPHLEEGWKRLEEGDFQAAVAAARRALELDAESPEAHTLLGVVASGQGQEDEALAHYRRATELDPEYVAPLLYAAELHLSPERDPEDALRLVEEALVVADEEEDYLDAVLLKAESLIALERDDEAKETLDELPPTDLPEAGYHLRAADCYLELEALDDAEAHLNKALEQDELADAYHGLGLVHELKGDLEGMTRAWLRVRDLDLEEPPPPWALSQDDFEKVAERAMAELPERIRTLLENVPVLASDYPSKEVVAEGYDPRMLGFFSGIPYPEKQNVGGATPHLDTVFLFQKNIERTCRSLPEVEREIRTTLLHETGHFFGLSEEDLHAMGLG